MRTTGSDRHGARREAGGGGTRGLVRLLAPLRLGLAAGAMLGTSGCISPAPEADPPEIVPGGAEIRIDVPSPSPREITVGGSHVLLRPSVPDGGGVVSYRVWRKTAEGGWDLLEIAPRGRAIEVSPPSSPPWEIAFSAATLDGELHAPVPGRAPDLRLRRIPGAARAISAVGEEVGAEPAAARSGADGSPRPHPPAPPPGGGSAPQQPLPESGGVLEIAGISSGPYAGGAGRYIFWRGLRSDGGPGTAKIAFSQDDGRTWYLLVEATPNVGKALVRLPSVTTDSARIRVTVPGASGSPATGVSRRFSVDSLPPTARIEEARVVDGSVRIRAFARDAGPAGVERFWLWTRPESATSWEAWPTPFPKTEPIVIALPPGTYGLWIVAEDAAGNRGTPPTSADAPQKLITVAPPAPTRAIVLRTFTGGGQYAGGTGRFIFWECPDGEPTGRIDIELSADGGETWRPIARDLENSGRYLWTLPRETGDRYRLRIIRALAGNARLEDASRSDFRIDSEFPRVFFEGPEISKERTTTIRYRWASGEPNGIVRLHVRPMPDGRWRLAKEAKVGEPLSVELADGLYAIAIAAQDEAGNCDPPPSETDSVADTLLVDTIPPKVSVRVEPESQPHRAGEVVTFHPRIEDENVPPFALRIEQSIDSGLTWKVLRPFHSQGHPFRLSLPDRMGIVLVRFTGEDLAGNPAAEIVALHIVLPDPEAAFEPLAELSRGYPLRAGSVVNVRWRTRGFGSGRSSWKLELSSDGGESWTVQAAGDGPGSVLAWSVPEGLDSSRCLLRLQVTREDGAVATALLDPFPVASRVPRVILTGSVEPAEPGRAADPAQDPAAGTT